MRRRGFFSVFYLYVIFYAIYRIRTSIRTDKISTFDEYIICLQSETRHLRNDEDLWNIFPEVVNACSLLEKFNVMDFSNTDEMKFHVMPKKGTFKGGNKCTVVSLGIGKVVDAEKAMKATLPECSFFGADPVNDINADIFVEVGKFFNVAVGHQNGTFPSYVPEDIYVKYVDIATFIRNSVRRRIIDQIMVDIEHAEYPMLPFFLKTGQLAKDGVTICQMNIEIHRPNQHQTYQFASFFRDIVREKQWIFMSTSTIIGHVRLYMINIAAAECKRRYFGNDADYED